MKKAVVTAKSTDDIKSVARKITQKGIDHVPVVDTENRIVGIVTSWDLAKAVAQDKKRLEEVMTLKVITAKEDEPVDVVARRMSQHNISGAPVTDQTNRLVGILTTDDLSKKLVGRI